MYQTQLLIDDLDDQVLTSHNKKYKVKRILPKNTYDFILNIHYAKRIPPISFAYGLYQKNKLIGIVTYGSPPSRSLCIGIAGEQYSKDILELNRLCLKNNEKNQASILVSASLKLIPKPKIIVSYADSSQNHVGFIYQATNFIYTGLSDKRKEWRKIDDKRHSKTISEKYSLIERKDNPDKFEHIDRPRKHRYVYVCSDKRYKKKFMKNIKYEIKSYPKFNR